MMKWMFAEKENKAFPFDKTFRLNRLRFLMEIDLPWQNISGL